MGRHMTATPTTKRAALAALVGAFAFQTALVYSDERGDPLDDTARRGRALWHENGCQVCHQLYGQGGFLGPDLTNAYSRVDTFRLRTLLTMGSGQMPAFHFVDDEIAAMSAFFKALDRPDLGWGQLRMGSTEAGGPWERFDGVADPMLDPATASSARRGWETFRRRPCPICHQPLAASPTGAPDLSQAAAHLSPDEFRRVLQEGRPARGMPPPAPALTEVELGELIAFITWLETERNAIDGQLRSTERQRSVSWRDIPWWEFR
jgi:nitric oxide reductase subunit C